MTANLPRCAARKGPDNLHLWQPDPDADTHHFRCSECHSLGILNVIEKRIEPTLQPSKPTPPPQA